MNEINIIEKKRKRKKILPKEKKINQNNSKKENEVKIRKEFEESNQNNIENRNQRFFNPYPEITSKHFYEDIYAKKEFRDYEIKESDIHDESACNPGEFSLSPFQSFLKNYISLDTPYNGILVMYSTGVGKTCAAISIAEGFKKTLKQMGKRILVLTTLRKNFEKELFDFKKEDEQKKSADEIVQCTGQEYELPKEMRHLSKEQKKKEVLKMIKNYYQFFGYQKFANYIIKMTNGWDGSEEKITDQIKHFIHKEFDDRVIIIDEVHNIKTDVKEEWKKSIQPILLSIVKYATNTKLVLMSATPMFDRPDEIIFILNLLLANDKRELVEKSQIFEKDGRLKEEAYELLPKLLQGYVSYARGEKPLQFPFRLYPQDAGVPNVEYYMNGKRIEEEKKLRFTKIVNCEMEGVQNATYLHFLEKKMKEGKLRKEIENENLEDIEITEEENVENENENQKNEVETKKVKIKVKNENKNSSEEEIESKTILNNLTYISTVVYPTLDKDPSEAKNNNNNENSLSKYGSYGKEGIDNESDNGRGGYYKVYGKDDTSRYVQYKYQSHAILNQGKPSAAPFMDETYLKRYSTKFAKILEEIKKAQGLCFAYSTYVDDGILPLALMLEQNGFERVVVKGETRLLDVPIASQGKWGKRPPICYACGKTLKDGNHQKDVEGSHVFRQAKYILYFGESKDIIKTTKEMALEKFTSRTNMNGEEIKVFLGTKTVSEGLNFKRIRQVHILQPWYNLSRHEQIIGRAIRTCSHQDLPLEKRNVEIYQYAAVLNEHTKGIKKNTETVDLKYYRIAENKDRIIKKIMRILKESAVDCHLFYKHNVIQSNETFKQITASGQELTVPVKDEPYSAMCDYEPSCEFDCRWKKDPRKEYEVDTDTYDLRFGTHDITQAKRFIKNIFRKENIYYLDDIVKEIRKMDPKMNPDFVYAALHDIVLNPKNNLMVDKYQRKGYILYRGDYYIFQPYGLREDLPVLYREKPLHEKPDYVSLEKVSVNYEEEIGDAVKEKKNEKKKKVLLKVNESINMERESIPKLNDVFFQSWVTKIKDEYAIHRKMIESSTENEYLYAILGFYLDRIGNTKYKSLMGYVISKKIRDILREERENSKMKYVNAILEYEKDRIIYLDDLYFGFEKKKKKTKKNLPVGYKIENEYFILQNLNENTEFNIETLNVENIVFMKANQEIMRRLKQKEELRQNTMPKRYEFVKLYGFLQRDPKKIDKYEFKIVDKEAEKGLKKEKGEKSLKGKVRGRVCESFSKEEVYKFRQKMDLYTYEGKLDRTFMCHDIEIFLRYQQEIQKKLNTNKIYFYNSELWKPED